MDLSEITQRERVRGERERCPKSPLRRGRNGSRKRLIHMTERLATTSRAGVSPRPQHRPLAVSDRILTLTQAEEIVPLSRSTLYRVAEEGADDSPFRKRGGRWLTTQSDLFRWVREGERGAGEPLHGRRRRSGSRGRSSFAEKVARAEGETR
jgi:predicted DNA-binding transcriptional regulator AlpA